MKSINADQTVPAATPKKAEVRKTTAKSVKTKQHPTRSASKSLLANASTTAKNEPHPLQAQDASNTFDPAQFVQKLGTWFIQAQRSLPWREPENAHDPYRILVSEVMLQQTTVTAVEPYYRRFLARFPTLHSLAEAPLDEVLSYWAGLGYYQRARNLHACAVAVVEKHNGQFPDNLEAVLALPGIGRYTAGAVLSIALDVPVPIVDTNVARVLARVLCLEGDLKAPTTQRRLWEAADQLIQTCTPSAEKSSNCRPSVINPALMELGALICVPRQPHCTLCPVESFCAARAAGREQELPHATPKPQVVELHDVCAFATRKNGDGEAEILLRQRSHDAKIWWRGMWELPRTTITGEETAAAALQRLLYSELGVKARSGEHLKTLHHGVTHHAITLDCWSVEIENMDAIAKPTSSGSEATVRWYAWDEISHLAIPSTMRRLLTWLRTHVNQPKQMSLL